MYFFYTFKYLAFGSVRLQPTGKAVLFRRTGTAQSVVFFSRFYLRIGAI